MGSSVLLGLAGQPFGIGTRNRLMGAGLQYTTINVFCAGFLLLFLLAGTSSARRYVNISVLRFLGYISYGLYLNDLLALHIYDWTCRRYFPQPTPSSGHFEMVLLRFAPGRGGAIAIAYLSRRFFEERFLRLKDSFVPKVPGSEGKTVVAPGSHGSTQAA
jgi:peptidoglycan/LPS O-acetylase OafA/YrhL